MSAMNATLERAAATLATPVARPPQVYGWRFPAEFRTRPLGWTERKQKPPAPPQESSVGGVVAPDPVLDRGPEGLAKAAVSLQEPDASNAPARATPAALAFSEMRHAIPAENATVALRPILLDTGPATGALAAQAACERQSNAGSTLLLRELGTAVVTDRREAETPMDVLAIGEACEWPSRSGNAAASLNEASYALA